MKAVLRADRMVLHSAAQTVASMDECLVVNWAASKAALRDVLRGSLKVVVRVVQRVALRAAARDTLRAAK